LDSDNGAEFINGNLWRYCAQQRITFTRSRPYRKNDQAHVEQKNWTTVRQFVGYDRFEGQAACDALNALYGPLRLYINFFQPVMAPVAKERHGARVKKTYLSRIAANSSISICSGTAPSMWTVSSMTVRGTPITWYLVPRCGNSTTSTMSPVMKSLSTASWCASNTARGQYGQVGVVNTWIRTGLVSLATISRVASERPESPSDTIRMSSISVPNSYPDGIPYSRMP